MWTARYENSGRWSYPKCLALDRDCNVYIAGDIWTMSSNADVAIIKYNPEGAEKWAIIYNDPKNTRDIANALMVDISGNVYVTGASRGKCWSTFKTIKFAQTGEDTLTTPVITGYELNSNIPNPFKKQTLIYYKLPRSSYVTLKIFNQLGQQVAFEDLGHKLEGKHAYHFKADNLTSGIYFYQLKAGDFMKTRKMVLVQ